jgi:hypothetical protein
MLKPADSATSDTKATSDMARPRKTWLMPEIEDASVGVVTAKNAANGESGAYKLGS